MTRRPKTHTQKGELGMPEHSANISFEETFSLKTSFELVDFKPVTPVFVPEKWSLYKRIGC